MAATDLLFTLPPITGHPVDLVFGETDTPVISTVTIDGGGTITGLRMKVAVRVGAVVSGGGVVTGLRMRVATEFDINVERPTVGEVRSRYQEGIDQHSDATSGWDQAAPTPTDTSPHFQDALPLQGDASPTWETGLPVRREQDAHFQQAMRLAVATLESGFQDGMRLRGDVSPVFQRGIPMRGSSSARFQEALRDRRNWAAVRYQEAVAHFAGVDAPGGRGVTLRLDLDSRYQEAMRPPAGIWIPPGPEPEDPCYIPPEGDAVHLLFKELWSGSTNLLFVCETHGPTPGDTVVVPVKEVYLVINSAVLIRVDGGAIIPTTSMSMSLDVDSWTWSFSASVPGYALPDIEPEDGVPVAVQATINGTPYRFIVESIARERTFGRNDLRVGGRGRAAVLDAPYAPIMSFSNEFGRTAEQLMNDILTDNGVPLGWTVEWNPDDWNVPAGVFNHQGSYISAMNSVAGSIAAYLQPHNTDETLRVLSRYPVAPWEWAGVTPDFELPAAVMSRESIEWRDKPRYNRVYVMGQQAGVNGRVTRAGTAGDYLAPSIVDPLITQAAAARQRGIAVLSDTGRIATVGLRLPVLAETGIIAPGSFVKYVDGGIERIGLTRSVQVEVGLPAIWQTLGVETHVEPV